MGNRLYVATVTIVWLAAMGWLVSERVLPPFFRGEPPVSGSLRQTDPVAWRIEMDDQRCGVAVLQAVDGGNGVIEVHSLLSLDRLPSPKGAPIWMKPLVDNIGDVSLEMRTRAGFDPLGRLAGFEMRLFLGDQFETPIRISGRVREGQLELVCRFADLTQRFTHAWPADGLLADELLPESKLMPIYPGRKWQKEVYSPFSSTTEPVELIQAEVLNDALKLNYENDFVDARVIEFRSPSKAGVSEEDRLRSTLYVIDGGEVIRQETRLLGSLLRFDRLGASESRALGEEILELDRYASRSISAPPLRDEAEKRGEPKSSATPGVDKL